MGDSWCGNSIFGTAFIGHDDEHVCRAGKDAFIVQGLQHLPGVFHLGNRFVRYKTSHVQGMESDIQKCFVVSNLVLSGNRVGPSLDGITWAFDELDSGHDSKLIQFRSQPFFVESRKKAYEFSLSIYQNGLDCFQPPPARRENELYVGPRGLFGPTHR